MDPFGYLCFMFLYVMLSGLYKFLVEKDIFTIFAYEIFKVIMKNCK